MREVSETVDDSIFASGPCLISRPNMNVNMKERGEALSLASNSNTVDVCHPSKR